MLRGLLRSLLVLSEAQESSWGEGGVVGAEGPARGEHGRWLWIRILWPV